MHRLTLTLGLTCLLATAAFAEDVTVYRDTWGVPHIYADSEPGAAYALGWCMAEDRLEDIHLNARTAIGGMAEFFGEDHVMTDYAMKMVENEKRCEEHWPKVREEIRDLVEAYVRRSAEGDAHNYPGPMSMYLAAGFEGVPESGGDRGRSIVVRKRLGGAAA